MLFEDKKIHIYSYNIETILSEKIETILRRGVYNSRMKDYYDVHMFLTKLKDEINIENFKSAITNTFTKRDSFAFLRDYHQILQEIYNYERIEQLWNTYAKKNAYASNIKFKEIVKELDDFIDSNNLVQLAK